MNFRNYPPLLRVFSGLVSYCTSTEVEAIKFCELNFGGTVYCSKVLPTYGHPTSVQSAPPFSFVSLFSALFRCFSFYLLHLSANRRCTANVFRHFGGRGVGKVVRKLLWYWFLFLGDQKKNKTEEKRAQVNLKKIFFFFWKWTAPRFEKPQKDYSFLFLFSLSTTFYYFFLNIKRLFFFFLSFFPFLVRFSPVFRSPFASHPVSVSFPTPSFFQPFLRPPSFCIPAFPLPFSSSLLVPLFFFFTFCFFSLSFPLPRVQKTIVWG